MTLHIEHHVFFHHFTIPEKLKHLIFFSILRILLLAALGVYLPIYIYNLYGIFYAMLYMSLYYGIFAALSSKVALEITKRKSHEFTQFISIISGLLMLILAKFLTISPLVIIPVAFLGSISLMFYWIPRHLILSFHSKREATAQSYALINIITTIVSILIPFVIAVLISKLGYSLFFMLYSLGLAILAALVYTKIRNQERIAYQEQPTEEKFDLKNAKRFIPLYFIQAFRNVIDFLAMFLIYLTLKNIVKFGIVNSIISLMGALATYVLAKFIDKKHDYVLGTTGFFLRAHIYMYLLFLLDPFDVALANIFLGLTMPIYATPFVGLFYNLVRRYGEKFVLYNEIFVSIFRAIIFWLVIILDLKLVLVLAVIGYIISGYIYYYYAIKEELLELQTKHL
jgi:MFS family permease